MSSENTPSPDSWQGIEDGNGVYGGDRKLDSVKDNRNWSVVRPSGNKPRARYYHAAAVIGRKMLVVGGDSDLGMLNDVQQLHLGKLVWSGLGCGPSINQGLSKAKSSQELPSCRGHSLVAWGKTLLLITGETDPPNEKVAVWSFDIEKESWSLLEAKGEIPVARTGQSVTRAGSVLILFGGEDAKGRKLNDLHMFDLKSSMWLPLHAMGVVPSPRHKHVAAMYDDRFLLVFGGASKSKLLNDLYALDFETMEWSRLKTRGISPGPRSESVGVLFGDKWYIAGGESSGTRCLETIMLDVARMTWCVVATSDAVSSSASQGFSMVLVQRKERAFLVTYGGKGPENEVQVLHIPPSEHSSPKRPAIQSGSSDFAARTADQNKATVLTSHALIDDDTGLIPLRRRFQRIEQVDSESKLNGKENQGKTAVEDGLPTSHRQGPLRQEKRSALSGEAPRSVNMHVEASTTKSTALSDDAIAKQGLDSNDYRPNDFDRHVVDSNHIRGEESAIPHSTGKSDSSALSLSSDTNKVILKPWKAAHEDPKRGIGIEIGKTDDVESKTSSFAELMNDHERKLAASLSTNAALELQLKSAVTSRDEAEKNLSTVIKSRQKTEKRLAVALKEIEDLKTRLAAAEIAQEESNSLANIVHSENLRLDHDLAFLKAVLEDTQKELQTTRGVLSGERSRAFQLQVELFELKQTIQHDSSSHAREGQKSLHA